MMTRKQILRKELNKIVKNLEQNYDPLRIILFGSLACGKVKDFSDIDLVIIKNTQKRFMDRLKEVALLCDNTVGVDFLVYTPGEISKAVKEKNAFICDEVIKQGKVLYERQDAG